MKRYTMILPAFILLLSGCSQKVYREITYKKDKEANFKNYKTFAWMPEKEPVNTESISAIMRNNTVNYFTHCFGEIGYQVDVENPDLLLELVVKSGAKEIENPLIPRPYSTTTVTTYFNPFLHPLSNPFKYNKPFTYKYFNYPTGKEPKPETYLTNAIILNVIDRAKQKIIWSSTASANLYDKKYLSMNLHPVVYEMLMDFPVKPQHKHKRLVKN